MKITSVAGALDKVKAGALVVAMDHKMKGAGKYSFSKDLTAFLKKSEFTGKPGELAVFVPLGRNTPDQVVVVGLGDLSKKAGACPVKMVRKAVGSASRWMWNKGCKKATFDILQVAGLRAGSDKLATAAVEALVFGQDRFSQYMTDKEITSKGLKSGAFCLPNGAAAGKARAGVKKGQITAEATLLARYVVNESPSVLTPVGMEKVARKMARANGLKIKVLNDKDLAKGKFGAFMAVGQGSVNPPRLIHMIYKPKNANKNTKKLGLIGKGVTFDSGGLSLKPAGAMDTMKCDMGGSAAVLGAMQAIAQAKPNVEVHGFLGMAENMPDGKSYRPGDILTSLSGKTVEVLNTDAEGRLVLIDTLTYAQKQKFDRLVDLATLTGACVVALGTDIAGVMGNNDDWSQDVLDAGKAAGEPMWPLPLPDDYAGMVKSTVADVRNTGTGRWGGAMTAGLFLKNFIENDTPWVHIDIAGPAFRESDNLEARRNEATGYGVRSLLALAEGMK